MSEPVEIVLRARQAADRAVTAAAEAHAQTQAEIDRVSGQHAADLREMQLAEAVEKDAGIADLLGNAPADAPVKRGEHQRRERRLKAAPALLARLRAELGDHREGWQRALADRDAADLTLSMAVKDSEAAILVRGVAELAASLARIMAAERYQRERLGESFLVTDPGAQIWNGEIAALALVKAIPARFRPDALSPEALSSTAEQELAALKKEVAI